MATLFARPTPLTGGSEGLARWLDMFAGTFFEKIPTQARPKIVNAIVKELLASACTTETNGWQTTSDCESLRPNPSSPLRLRYHIAAHWAPSIARSLGLTQPPNPTHAHRQGERRQRRNGNRDGHDQCHGCRRVAALRTGARPDIRYRNDCTREGNRNA